MSDEAIYDPDAAPERTPWEFKGTLLESKRIENADEAAAAGFGDNYRTYMEKAGRSLNTPVWFLKAKGLDRDYENGDPYYATEMIVLTDKNGKYMTKGMAPDQLAQKFLALGQSASWNKVGTPESAVGRTYQFSETEIKLGKKGFTKRIGLFPVELITDPSTIVCDLHMPVKGSEATPEAPADADPDTVSAIASALNGTTRAQVFNVIMSTPSLKGIARVFGQDLIQVATDGSLADLLVKAGYLVDDGGVLRAQVGAAA